MKLPRRALRILLTAIPMSVLVAAAAVGHLGVPQVRGAEPIIDVLFVDGSPSGGPTGPTTTIVSPAEGVLQGNVSGYATRPGAAITFQVYPGDTVEDGDHWSLDFEAPPNEILVPGTYQATDDAYLATGLAYLRVSGAPTGCVATEASFTVIEASFDAAGAPTTFAASFMRSCGDTDPQRGEIRYHSIVGVR